MNRRTYFLLFILGVAVTSLVALFQYAPGYMDADYYYAGGERLAEGRGFTEEFLWNYLDNPSGLPHPSHAYWMPLTSLVAALGMKLSGSTDFWAAKLGFIFIAGSVAPLTSALAYAITKRQDQAVLAGLLAAIPGFYLVYQGTTDIFGIYMVLGAVWLLLALDKGSSGRPQTPYSRVRACALGIVSGLFHLARADGVMWLFIAGVAIFWQEFSRSGNVGEVKERPGRGGWLMPVLGSWVALGLGYLAIMGPWMRRNLGVFGTPLSPGGLRALWLTNYDEIFSYPSTLLTPERWWASGLPAILQARWYSLGQNLQTFISVQGEIFLVPLILLGLWSWRKDLRVRLGLLAWILTLLVMTAVFPFVGWRGGFFHSGAALQPLFWSVVPTGLEVFVHWGQRVRRWEPRQASRVFAAGLVGLAVFLSFLIVQRRVVGASLNDPAWGKGWTAYSRMENILKEKGISSDEVVMVNNSPGYYIASRRPALTIPNGGIEVTMEVGKRYGAGYLLLESNHPAGLNELYDHPTDLPGLKYLFTINATHVFALK